MYKVNGKDEKKNGPILYKVTVKDEKQNRPFTQLRDPSLDYSADAEIRRGKL